MSRFSGPQVEGRMRVHKDRKRIEAAQRQELYLQRFPTPEERERHQADRRAMFKPNFSTNSSSV